MTFKNYFKLLNAIASTKIMKIYWKIRETQIRKLQRYYQVDEDNFYSLNFLRKINRLILRRIYHQKHFKFTTRFGISNKNVLHLEKLRKNCCSKSNQDNH